MGKKSKILLMYVFILKKEGFSYYEYYIVLRVASKQSIFLIIIMFRIFFSCLILSFFLTSCMGGISSNSTQSGTVQQESFYTSHITDEKKASLATDRRKEFRMIRK